MPRNDPSKYRGNICSTKGITGVISVCCQQPLIVLFWPVRLYKVIFGRIGSAFVPYFYKAASSLPANVFVGGISSLDKRLRNTGLTFHSVQQNWYISNCLTCLPCVCQIVAHGWWTYNALSQGWQQLGTLERLRQCSSLGQWNACRNSFTRYILVIMPC